MARRTDTVEIKSCDFCDRDEDRMSSVDPCWSCGKDCCNQHRRYASIEGFGPGNLTYLCDDCHAEMKEELDRILAHFRRARPDG